MTMDNGSETPPAPVQRRERKSRAGWIAALFVVALAGWMGSGYVLPSQEPPQEPHESSRERQPMAVETLASQARAVTRFVASEGEALPDQQTPVRARVAGTVESISAKKGDYLNKGAVVAKIALADRAAQLAQAQATLEARQRDLDAAERLAKSGYATSQQLTDARAALAAAQAALAEIQETAGQTQILAPITGVLDEFDLDLGEVVSANDEVGTQIDIDPLVVEIEIPQQSIAELHTGQTADVSFITGQDRQGTVRYIASSASSATRTFTVEVAVPNPDRNIPAGISAQVRIPVGEVPAHFVSTALLALDTEGTLGIKAVNADDTVEFYPVDLVRAETRGIWVSGLPDQLNIISVGQGFVSAGETVRAVAASEEEKERLAEPAGAMAGIGDPDKLAPQTPHSSKQTQNFSQGDSAEAPTSDGRPAQNVEELFTELAGQVPPETGIRLLQERLQSLGFDPGPADGVIGESTRTAIRNFQRSQGQPATGEITPDLIAALLKATMAER
ncbi:efflux RND transporter periplasmic adaptor subunit [Consotaella aegiceratis]|uniref:efflux RND transporter periplasmic adaptor subunit n=1 Tax=Consotaella aegiceratis TaxID=3097961 RepID=UPI002F414ADB